MATSSLWKWIFAAILLTASLSHAQTIKRVPADFPSIQAAIDASANGDTVLVSPGTYRENIDFRGKRITVQSESGPESTIIDGGGSGTVVKFVTREDESTVIRGFTIQNGSQSYEGGGIGVSGSSPKILGNRIINNLGCGISVNFGSPVIQGNTISHNQRTCGVGAGAIYLGGSSSPQVLDNIISDNTGGSIGGAIIDWSADKAVIRNNIIMGNKGSGEGGIGYGKAIFFNWTDTEPELGFGGLSVFGAMSLQLAFAVIPEDLRKKYGCPELTADAKRKILGLNSAKLYGIKGVVSGNLQQRFKPVPSDYEKRMSKELKTLMELPGFTGDNLSQIKQKYAELDVEPSHTRHGWTRVKS
ncbi:MAG: hypothetical protein AUG08_12360 [Acidobacteria bacterium 13_1_20CM_2_55_15]|nr:MAG: hypothetical protein AUG08_12360 [Acidobacteria bacterium 13_1_20CM_2_55_15]